MNQAEPANISYPSFAEQALALVSARSPVVKRTLDRFGSVCLIDYLRQSLSICETPLQSRNDLLEVVYRYTAPLLGGTIAEKAAQELQSSPAVLTANHHGVDFLAQSVQGSLLFSLREVGGKPAATVPVFACGNVPLNNPTFPRGLLLYHADRGAPEFRLPIRLPVFLDRHKRQSVSVVEAYDAAMLVRTEQRLAAMMRTQQIPFNLAAAAEKILGEDYRSSLASGLKSYSQQAVVLNNLIWKRCFREPEQVPEMVFLELEKIASLLLQVDLQDENSLMWQIMFNPMLRDEVLSQLDGAKACWDRGKLTQLANPDPNDKKSDPGGCGTIFFWAIDNTGRRVPLTFTGSPDRQGMLQGRDDRGELCAFSFNSQDITQSLQAGKLLPSLFTCYSAISLARGISCCGGYFQADYLSNIQNVLVGAFSEIIGEAGLVEDVNRVPTSIYLSGMQGVMRSLDSNFLLPAGPIEIIASGGLSPTQIEQMRLLTVRDAHLGGLAETLPDFLPRDNLPDNWQLLMAEECNHLLKNRTLVI